MSRALQDSAVIVMFRASRVAGPYGKLLDGAYRAYNDGVPVRPAGLNQNHATAVATCRMRTVGFSPWPLASQWTRSLP